MTEVTALDKPEIQGIVFSGYPEMPEATFLVLEVIDGARARGWLGRLAGAVTDGQRGERRRAVNVAFTHAGLAALGLAADALATFPIEFIEGMAGSPARRHVLGDSGASAPDRWLWGAPGAADVHVLLLLYGADEGEIGALLAGERAAYAGALREVLERETCILPEQKEHFGFADAISQPRIEGSGASQRPGSLFLKPGEFILGYDNEYDRRPLSPSVAPSAAAARLGEATMAGRRDLGRNGTYLVVRHLAQDVAGFWGAMAAQAGLEGGVVSDLVARERAVGLASKCIGRWPDGTPLAAAASGGGGGGAKADELGDDRNGFGYHEHDRAGRLCPIGARVRRANPRDSLEPGPEQSRQVVRRHMMIRRGRSYGPGLAPFAREDVPQDRGLVFIAVGANISRQFEFIQQTWINNPKFDGLYDEVDPLVGARAGDRGAGFTIPEKPVRRRLEGLPAFVTTRGGAYFFLPSLTALRYLAALGG